jgi:hypothetical protein
VGTRPVWLMSALPPKADIAQTPRDVRFVPKADIGQSKSCRRKYTNIFGSAKDRFPATPLGLVHLRLSAIPRIDLDQLLVGDGSKVRRLFPYVRQLATVEMGCLLLIPNGHAPQFVPHVFATFATIWHPRIEVDQLRTSGAEIERCKVFVDLYQKSNLLLKTPTNTFV